MKEPKIESDKELIRKLTYAVEQSASTVVITDSCGIIEYVNPRYEKLTGYARDEVIGRRPSISKSGQTKPEVYRDMWQAITSGIEWRGEILNKKKNGEIYWASLTLSPIKNEKGEITNYLGIEEDITERKTVSAKLEETLLLLTRTNKELDQFTSVVAHDLQGPLCTIFNALEVALKADSETEFEDRREMVSVALSCARKAQGLVADLLQYSRAGGVKLETKRISVKKIIDIALQNLEFEVEMRQPKILIGELPTIVSSENFLVQVYQNLLANALKYNDAAHPEIEIKAELAGDDWLFSVKDNGIGIPSEQIARIFEPFIRATTAFPGTGLGLATCKKSVERLGGSIWATSEPGKGSTFLFKLPASPVGQA